MITAATLFSGIGAPECAMPQWDWRWHAEIEPFPKAVLAARHPQSINLGDVNAEDFVERAIARGRPRVLVFGSPCQDFSVAGQRVGLDGARGNLALVALNIARHLRPQWLVFENVPGLFSSYSGSATAERSVREGPVGGTADGQEDSDFAAFLSAVRECGYLGCYRVLDAQYSGVPQRRRRIFLVGHLGDWRPPAAVLFESESLRGNSPPRREAGERVAPTVEARANAGGAGWGTDFMSGGGLAVAGTVKASLARGSADEAECGTLITGSVSSKWAKGTGGPAGDECYNLVAFSCKDYGNDTTEDLSPPLRALNEIDGHANGGGQVAIAFQTRVARNGRGGGEDVIPALNGADAGATSDMRPCVAILHENQRAEVTMSDTAGSLKTGGGKPGQGYPAVAVFKPSHYTRGKDGAPSDVSPPLGAEPDKGDQDPVLFASAQVRRLTPRECERLQGFEDDYTLIRYPTHSRTGKRLKRPRWAADGPRYKALGNAMNVNDIRWVLQRIEQFERLRCEN